MWKAVLLFAVLSSVTFAQESTSVAQCVNNPGEMPLNTHIEGCVDPPCLLPQLEDVVVHMVFTTRVNNPGEMPLNTHIEGCVDPPCLLPQLEDVVVHMVFTTPHTIRSLRTLATAYMTLGFITVPVPYDLGTHAETCNFLTNSYCPVLEGEVLQYTLRMFIESFFPIGTAVTLEFRVVDTETGDAVLCIRVPIRIEPPRDTVANTNAAQASP